MTPPRIPLSVPLLTAALLLALALPGTAVAARRTGLELHELSLDLPAAPAAIVTGNLDDDGFIDLVVVTAYTEWGSIVTEESVKMDEIDGFIEMMTVVPAIADRRQILVFRGLQNGGFARIGDAQDLSTTVLSVFTGPFKDHILALTDDGIDRLRLDQGAIELRYESVIRRRPVLAGSGVLMSDLVVLVDANGDGRLDLLFPGRTTWDVFSTADEGLATEPTAQIRFEDRPPLGSEPRPSDSASGSRRVIPLPSVDDLDGDQLPDVLMRGDGRVWHHFEVARGTRSRGFGPAESVESEKDRPAGSRGDIVYFGDLDGDGQGEYVLEEELGDEDAGWRKDLKQAKNPQFRYFIHDSRPDFTMVQQARRSFEAIGYGFGGSDEYEMPFGLQDLDADGRLDLVTLTLDFSLWQAVRILTVRSLSVGLDFHVWCQQPDGSFRGVQGLDLSGKFNLQLDDFKIGQLSQFSGDFDGDGRADFVQMGKGREVTIHKGQAGCKYPTKPDLELRLREEPLNLALVKVRDLDGDALSDIVVIQPQERSKDGLSRPVRLDLYLSRTAEP